MVSYNFAPLSADCRDQLAGYFAAMRPGAPGARGAYSTVPQLRVD